MDIFEAARQNNPAALREALRDNHPDVRDGRGSTPLIIAVYYNSKEAATLLLDSGANTEAQDSTGNTALMGACFKGYAEAAEIPVERRGSTECT